MKKKMSRKLPLVVYPSYYNWGSHRIIFPRLTEMLRKLPARGLEINPRSAAVSKDLARKIEREASCLIYLPHFSSGFGFLRALRRHKVNLPVIVFETSHMCYGGIRYFENRKLWTKRDWFVTSSAVQAGFIGSMLGTKRVRAIPFPVLKEEMTPMTEAENSAFRKSLGLTYEEKMIVYCGRLTPQKNIDGLLRVFAEARKRNPRLRLFLIGAFENEYSPFVGVQKKDAYRGKIRRLIRDLSLSGSVSVMKAKSREEIRRFFSACDAHVNLSLYHAEEFGYAVAEGLACGAPTLVTAWGGLRDYARGDAALAVPVDYCEEGPKINEALASKRLLRLLDPASRRLWKRRGLRYAKRLRPPLVLASWRRLVYRVETGCKTDPLPVAFSNRISEFFLEYLAAQKCGPKTRPKTYFSSHDHWFAKWHWKNYAGRTIDRIS